MMAQQGAFRRVVYVSRAVPAALAGRSAVLAEILGAARRNNARAGVTGALLYSDRRFAQVLEGPPQAVDDIFETIQCDTRHDDVTVLRVTSESERAFGDWSMALAELPHVTPADFDAPDAAERLVGMLRSAIRNTEAASG